jgi:hypothetical protein
MRSALLAAICVCLGISVPAAAAVELRYERIFELDGREASRGPVTVWIDGDRARYDSSVGQFFTSDEAGVLTHLRPDDTAVDFELPIRFEEIASPEGVKTLEAVRGMVEGEREVRAVDETRVIAGRQARLVEIVTILHVGGRIETQMWVATERRADLQPFFDLLGGVGQLLSGFEPWREVAAAEGLLPLEVVTTTTGQSAHQKVILRLVSFEEPETLPAGTLELPADVEWVPFAMEQYFQVHR